MSAILATRSMVRNLIAHFAELPPRRRSLRRTGRVSDVLLPVPRVQHWHPGDRMQSAWARRSGRTTDNWLIPRAARN